MTTTTRHVVILPTTRSVTRCHTFLRVSLKFCETGLFTIPLLTLSKSTVLGTPNIPDNGHKQLLEHRVY